MHELIECELTVSSNINGQIENVLIEGKGYYREDSGCITIYFSSGTEKYKYVYDGNLLTVSCGDSCYRFRENYKEIGEVLAKLINERQMSQTAQVPQEQTGSSNLDELKKLKELLEAGIITQEEFDVKKKELLNL